MTIRENAHMILLVLCLCYSCCVTISRNRLAWAYVHDNESTPNQPLEHPCYLDISFLCTFNLVKLSLRKFLSCPSPRRSHLSCWYLTKSIIDILSKRSMATNLSIFPSLKNASNCILTVSFILSRSSAISIPALVIRYLLPSASSISPRQKTYQTGDARVLEGFPYAVALLYCMVDDLFSRAVLYLWQVQYIMSGEPARNRASGHLNSFRNHH